jgi:RNA polymerase sigma factor (sigma-70 family)
MIATRRGMESARTWPTQVLAAESDRDLVEAVRDGDDSAFEELYRRYHDRIAAYVRRMVRDPARAEDLAQDAFFSALRRMRATDAEIAFKPWIFEIARNATIDHWRRSSRAEEISVDADDQLSASDRGRLVGSSGPDSALVDKERLEHLRGAFDELSDVHTRILVMRELEGLSYREIAEKLDLSRASVESALFRARRRLETEYADISEGRRCAAMRTVMAHVAEGVRDKRDETRLARHARRCHVCRRRARELGVEPLAPFSGLRQKVAALLPLPLLTKREGDAAHGGVSGLLPAGAQVSAAVAERAAAIVAAAALAGAGGVALGGSEVIGGDGDRQRQQPAIEQRAPGAAPAETRVEGAEESGRPEAAGARGEPGAQDETGTTAGGKDEATVRGHADQAGGADAAAGEEGAGGADGAGKGDGAGEVGLPQLPGVQRESSGDGPDLPTPPAPPTFDKPSVPDVTMDAPVAEAPRAQPVDLPAREELSGVDAGAQLDAVKGIAAG